jgi:pimeloyl-ACP methyl ester carboxylesterase
VAKDLIVLLHGFPESSSSWRDVALGRRAADLTADYVTGPYRYEVLDGVSRWMPEEVPELVAKLVLDFIGAG